MRRAKDPLYVASMISPSTNSQKYKGSATSVASNLFQNSPGSTTSPTYSSTSDPFAALDNNRRPHPRSAVLKASVGTKARRWSTRFPHTPFSHSSSRPKFNAQLSEPSPSHTSALGSIPRNFLLVAPVTTLSVTRSNLVLSSVSRLRPANLPARMSCLKARGGGLSTVPFLCLFSFLPFSGLRSVPAHRGAMVSHHSHGHSRARTTHPVSSHWPPKGPRARRIHLPHLPPLRHRPAHRPREHCHHIAVSPPSPLLPELLSI
mmetsp:Transcript_61527/g.127143  ORF Transcript_61527/g.127143 Transcript_61527/m.127143 type:complete len:261 (-) Transcript_61527:835-1617(-)